jgi:hypothetical protein
MNRSSREKYEALCDLLFSAEAGDDTMVGLIPETEPAPRASIRGERGW